MARRYEVVVALLAGLLLGAACSVSLGDDLKYACSTDKDCGGEGWVCAKVAKLAYCCHRSGAETCNQKDDDCDGVIDNGFDLKNDALNCGGCGQGCTALQTCSNGKCVIQATNCAVGEHCADPGCNLVSCGEGCVCKGGKKSEEACNDGEDNDGDGQKDCADPDCNQQACGGGCLCRGGAKAEVACDNGRDDDLDLKIDCADEDCVGVSGDAGVTCRPDGGAFESNCGDNFDNDGDGLADCLDSDCELKGCLPYSGFEHYQCNVGRCDCHGIPSGVQETSQALCSDGIDNDCNGLTDCADGNCHGRACTLGDGGTGTCTNNACQ